MAKNIEINFAKVEFHIKEFQKVYILENCSLVFYEPYHLQTKDKKKEGKTFEYKEKKDEVEIVYTAQEQEIIKTKSQEHIEAINKEKEEKISKLGLNADNIDSEFKNIKEEDYQTKAKEHGNKEFRQDIQSKRNEKFKDYDIFYDVYTSKENKYKSINRKIGFNPDGFKVKNGIAQVKAGFFQECFTKGIYHLIPRLISKQKDEALHFDPVPLEDKGFVVTDFRVDNIKNIKKDLIFQRKIAEIENPNLVLQSPKDFLSALNGGRDFTEDDKKQQAQAIQTGCELKVKEMEKILLKQDKSLKDIIKDDKKLDEKIENLRKNGKTSEEMSLLGRLEFLQNNKKKVKDYKEIIENLENPQATDNQQSNTGDSNIEDTDKKKPKTSKKGKKAPLDKEKTNTPNGNKSEDKPKTINAKDIGDTGEYVVSLLFSNKSTRYLSNRRKMDANFNHNGFNHTIPDFLVTLNDYPTLVEVKNVQEQSLTEQISFELKLAREYELDYLFVCNDYTKLTDNITKLVAFDATNSNHKGSRSGFIDHRHLHRSIKTIFKEIYIHHIKGAAPNKIMIKRMDLNDAAKMEKEFNENQSLQKN